MSLRRYREEGSVHVFHLPHSSIVICYLFYSFFIEIIRTRSVCISLSDNKWYIACFVHKYNTLLLCVNAGVGGIKIERVHIEFVIHHQFHSLLFNFAWSQFRFLQAHSIVTEWHGSVVEQILRSTHCCSHVWWGQKKVNILLN